MKFFKDAENILSLQIFGYGITVIISSIFEINHSLFNNVFRSILVFLAFYYLINNKLISPNKPYLFWLICIVSLRIIYEIPNNDNLYQNHYYFYIYWFVFCVFVNLPLIFIRIDLDRMILSLKYFSFLFFILLSVYYFFIFDLEGRLRIEINNEMYFNPIGISRCLVICFFIFYHYSRNYLFKILSLLIILFIFLTGTRIALFPIFLYFSLIIFKRFTFGNFIIIISILLLILLNEFEVFDRLISRSLDQEVRFLQWSSVLYKLKDYFLFGYGLFDPLYNHLTHNIYLEFFVVMGVPLSLLFFFLLFKNNLYKIKYINIAYLIFGFTGLSVFMNPEVLALIFVNNGKVANK